MKKPILTAKDATILEYYAIVIFGDETRPTKFKYDRDTETADISLFD
jgi:hypothetical protein